MSRSIVKAVLRRVRAALRRNPDRFLRDVRGVIHVGANVGQERELYRRLGLSAIWIEPIPDVFAILKENIRHFDDQRAFQCLITDRDDQEYQFHVANNQGASSSILELKQHKDIWPEVSYTRTIALRSLTLTSLLQREKIALSGREALVMDTQGSELLVLKGALPIIDRFRYVKTEVADFESYEGCCQLAGMDAFMEEHGFRKFSRRRFAERKGGGTYFDVVYKKRSS